MRRSQRTCHHRHLPPQLLPLAGNGCKGERIHLHHVKELAAHAGDSFAGHLSARTPRVLLRTLRRAGVPLPLGLRTGYEVREPRFAEAVAEADRRHTVPLTSLHEALQDDDSGLRDLHDGGRHNARTSQIPGDGHHQPDVYVQQRDARP